MIKTIVSKSIFLAIKESIIFIFIRMFSLARDFFEVVINQAAAASEIERLRGETTLAFSEFIINHQGSFLSIFGFGIFLLVLLALYIFWKDCYNILKIIKEEGK